MKFLKYIHLLNKHDYVNRCKLKVISVTFRNYSSSDFQERRVQIKTCGSLYRKWKEEKLFKKVPSDDLTFEVKFIDSELHGLESKQVSPTVLALHGAPGSWKDFSPLLSYLRQRGCRVIAPNFPDFTVCKPGIFRHSHLEKAQYVKDFLAAISVSHIDMLILHSAAVYAGLNLCLDDELVVKSLALLNPGTCSVKGMHATKHLWFLKTLVKVTENPILFEFAKSQFGAFFLKNVLKVRVKVDNVLNPMLSATAMVYGDIDKSEPKFWSISKKMPIFYAFSDNDPLISKQPSYDLAKIFGADYSDIFIYNKEGVLVQEGRASSKLKVLAFQEGSHYVFLKHPNIINPEVADFLESHMKKSR